MKPKLLDLCCCAGGMSMGYHQAGFDVTGIDIEDQPHYPFKFIKEDVMKLDVEFLSKFDLLSASPPCQNYSELNALHKKEYPRLIEPIREMLIKSGCPYVIENVPAAPLKNKIMLCGTMFGLKVYRHRIFEMSFFILTPPHFPHHDNCPGVGRGISKKGFISVTGQGGFGIKNGHEYAKNAMDINWMSRKELSQAIPPAYSKYIGEQFLDCLERDVINA